MIVFPNAKINIGLNIVDRRSDGFHNISTFFYPVKGLCDILEVIIAEDQDLPLTFSQTGVETNCPANENLCVRAVGLMSKRLALPPIAMHLHKVIPTGAGLGGGSADGSFTLVAINELLGNPLGKKELMELSLQLGSDCPFFIENQPCLAEGRGEKIRPLKIDLSGYFLLVLKPDIHVETGKAYSETKPAPWGVSLVNLIKDDINTWRLTIKNDFEEIIFTRYPQIGEIKKRLYGMGAIYAGLSGSGSAVYGIFDREPKDWVKREGYFIRCVRL